jgi:hypothetical protein
MNAVNGGAIMQAATRLDFQDSIRRSLLAAAAAWGLLAPSASSDTMVAYGKNGRSSVPAYRRFDGAAWGAELTANSIGAAPQWLVLRGSPIADQFAMAALDNDVDVEVQVWDGSTWGSVFQATSDAGDKTTRLFDIAYEHRSGHLLLVYRESGTPDVRYRTFNGSSWSAESSFSMTSNVIKWLSLTPVRGTDEMMLVAMSDDSSDHTRAAMWNGSSFTNLAAASGASGLGSREHAAGALEGLSGQGLWAFSQSTSNPGYRTLTGGAWSGSFNAPSVGATPQWSCLASDASSDEIVLAVLDSAQDINVNVWSGSAWGANLEAETSAASVSRRGLDVAYENGGNEALLVYDDNSNRLKYRTWNGSAWSAEQSGPHGGNAPIQVIQAVSGSTPGQVFVTWTMDNAQIRTAVWNGSFFGAATPLAVSSAPKEYEAFMVATSAGGDTPSVVQWTEVEPE